MKILGLTGGSGTGKSAACTAFARLGCGVIDADATYRTLCDTCEPMLKEIQNVFGDVFSTDGKLDRKKLGAIVFADAQKLQQLNAITHPYIRQAARDAFAAYSKRGCLLCIYDAPVLFEGQMETLCDKTCAVLAARNTRIARIVARDAITEEYAALRIDAQKDDAFYRERCDYVVQNDADLDTLYTQVRKIYEDMVRK
ncbi:MAG: dephospho-CoA kinase [Eubacteriales bacterium]|jgi:dephospho-CoA kinase|uniref:Dephospho-CoA kinase n=1 Tax=Butyricicoccus intestinisimiae TaxID=2841509 RepID=A0ABS6ERZ2_9FIRM|nr:dephospho-CoA kinase [Butyricicoccus intestinisimiae]MBU5490265.1 dephospho-CoA kinase [Butyricicoccus intestinisimiae]MDO5805668.1 dephospho-CoA kinase [Eubacteriales bacterium]MEE0326394.1 dephospho-CoA kinase [Butyricicoccus sp.]